MERLEKIYEARRILNNLRELGESLKEYFDIFEKVINQEKFPEALSLKGFSEEFSEWEESIDKCSELYEQLFDSDKPRTFPEFEKALNAEENRLITASIFERAEKFLTLNAKSSDVQKILVKYQKKLKPLLGKKSRDSKLQAKVEPYAKFIETAEEKDFGKKFVLGKALSETFDDDFIGKAVFGGDLLFDGEQPEPPELDDESPVETVDFAEIVRENDALLTDDDFAPFERAFTFEDCGREREITAKRFKRDFENPNGIKLVLFTTLNNGGYSKCAIPVEDKFPREPFEAIAQLLFNKGYFQKYVFANMGDFYSLTQSCYDFFKSEVLKKFFKNIGKEPLIEPDETLLLGEGARKPLARMIYFRLYAIEREHGNYRKKKALFAQSFRVEFSGRNGRDLGLGCFWENLDECNDFFDNLKAYLATDITFQRVILAGLTLQHAEKIFIALETALAENFPKDTVNYIYLIDEDKFYLRGEDEAIVPEKIWVKLSTDDDAKKTPLKFFEDKFTNADEVVEEIIASGAFDEDIAAAETPDDEIPAIEAPAEKIPVVEAPVEKISAVETPAETFDDEPITDEMQPLNEMLAAKKFYCAAAYLKALTAQDENYIPLYHQLAYAINDPLLAISYDSGKIISLFNESDNPDENFLTAATLRTFFYNHKQFDHNMKVLHGIVKNFEVVEENSPLADLIFALMNFKEKAKNGADYYADYRVKNRAQIEIKIAKLRQEAQTCLDIINNPRERANNPRFIETRKILFKGSELTNYLEHIAEEIFDEDILHNLKNYLQEEYMRDDDISLNVENIDKFKFDTIIDDAWEQAGKNIRRKKNMSLVGELRNHVNTLLKRAIEILCERVSCFEESAPLKSDIGSEEYKRIRKNLIDNIKKAQAILTGKKIPAAAVLHETLQEIADKLEGNFKPEQYKYFYIDFLRGDKVLLDENYFPNFNFNTLDGTNNSIAGRIVTHSRADLPTFAERMEIIFEKKGWDFGSAKLIDDYLEDIGEESIITKNKYKLRESADAAKRIALNDKKKFFGFLELAQSYGQFDNAPENSKEKILKLIDRCFEFAQGNDNIGVFFRVKNYWENKTKEDAAKYAELVEKNLERGIKNYCRKTDEDEDSPALKNTVAQIQKMIDRRNYTVAQGLINRLGEGKLYDEPESSEGQTHLQHFLEDYEIYYNRVRKSGESFKNLVGKNQKFSKAATSKAIKGGEILVDNWIPNGFPQNGDVGEDRLAKLLNTLGFKVESVSKTGAISKNAINYKVKLIAPRNVQTSNYNHPIAAFGSNAEIYGFRVTCIFGTYNAEGLIARFKEIGNAENTLVLLDYALELPTRRSLARKIKAESGITKIFAVVDRVLMMYLVKNYDDMQINKILMSLIMPFAACQPYVFNPNVPIPPEIFMGREKEMRRILDFDDVNIVYGGRQLGKTALLKMACASLDRNENNDRAILVSLDKCNCAAAALKISQALRADEFFDETFADTYDWTKLAAAIKKRLASDTPYKIPHFMLALDEADDFIKDCRDIDFKPVLELIDIQNQLHNGSRFKFVMAGLRDVVRFYRDEALGNNNQISKLPSLVVKPFDLEDATRLLKEPLRCLGLYFSDNENADSLAMMILETTNYFPGLIQLYCARLIEALSKSDYASYKETNSPIYEIKEGHIQSVLGEESFNEEIKNKINMTLRLGDDKFYYVIAHLMAWRYHNDDSIEGYSAKDILDTAEEFGIEELIPQNSEQVEALLKELCELNILREVAKGKYLFVRQRFLNMMGTSDEIEAEIMSDFSRT